MIQRIETNDAALAVAWKAGGESRFPFLWLRDNCRCPRCRDPRNGQRLFDALDLPAEPTPADRVARRRGCRDLLGGGGA